MYLMGPVFMLASLKGSELSYHVGSFVFYFIPVCICTLGPPWEDHHCRLYITISIIRVHFLNTCLF